MVRSLLRAWVQSLVRGLRSHKLRSETRIHASMLLRDAGEVLPADIRAELLGGEKQTLKQWAERRSCVAGQLTSWLQAERVGYVQRMGRVNVPDVGVLAGGMGQEPGEVG